MRTFLIALAIIAVLALADGECGATITMSGKKYKYDLSALKRNPSESHVATDSDFNYYYINFCDVTNSGCVDTAAVCQRAANYNYYSCGAANTASYMTPVDNTIAPGQGISVKYTGGDKYSSGLERQSVVTVICDPDQTGPEGDWVDVHEVENIYYLSVEHAGGCGVSKGGASSAGETFALAMLIIILGGLFLYFVIGFIICKFVLKKEGSASEMIPNHIFWSSLPGLIVDGCKFIGHGFKKGDYVSV